MSRHSFGEHSVHWTAGDSESDRLSMTSVQAGFSGESLLLFEL